MKAPLGALAKLLDFVVPLGRTRNNTLEEAAEPCTID